MIQPMLRRSLWLLALLAVPATADVDGYPVRLEVGGTFDICASGTIMCPAFAPICDDLGIATVRDGPAGLQLVAVAPGTTLCSALSSNKLRAVYRVTVTKQKSAATDAGAR